MAANRVYTPEEKLKIVLEGMNSHYELDHNEDFKRSRNRINEIGIDEQPCQNVSKGNFPITAKSISELFHYMIPLMETYLKVNKWVYLSIYSFILTLF